MGTLCGILRVVEDLYLKPFRFQNRADVVTREMVTTITTLRPFLGGNAVLESPLYLENRTTIYHPLTYAIHAVRCSIEAERLEKERLKAFIAYVASLFKVSRKLPLSISFFVPKYKRQKLVRTLIKIFFTPLKHNIKSLHPTKLTA